MRPAVLQTDAAACRQVGFELFFPGIGEGSGPAKSICARCEVSDVCGEYALTYHLHGIWGGTNDTDRERIRRQRREVA